MRDENFSSPRAPSEAAGGMHPLRRVALIAALGLLLLLGINAAVPQPWIGSSMVTKLTCVDAALLMLAAKVPWQRCLYERVWMLWGFTSLVSIALLMQLVLDIPGARGSFGVAFGFSLYALYGAWRIANDHRFRESGHADMFAVLFAAILVAAIFNY